MTISRTGYVIIAGVFVLIVVSGVVFWLRQRSLRSLPVLNQAEVSTNTQKDATASIIATTDAVIEKRTFLAPPVQKPPQGFKIVLIDGVSTLVEVDADAGVASTSTPPAVVPPPTDTDGDGLTDDQERQLGTGVTIADTDADGLSDGDEVKKYRTDPLKADSDGDGYSDAEEIKNGYNPLGTGTCLTTGCTF